MSNRMAKHLSYKSKHSTAYPVETIGAEDFYRHTQNLREYRNRAGEDAYWQMVQRIDKDGEKWQAVDVDICRELECLDGREDETMFAELRHGG
jgi:hypothetical protein